MWDCPKCGAKIDPAYVVCWRCGTSLEGVEDPGFVVADEAGPIADPGPDLGAEAGGLGSADLVECYLARDVPQARYLADQLTGLGVPAVADTQDLRLRGAGAATTNPLALGNPYFGPRVRVRREDQERARAWLEEYDRGGKAGG